MRTGTRWQLGPDAVVGFEARRGDGVQLRARCGHRARDAALHVPGAGPGLSPRPWGTCISTGTCAPTTVADTGSPRRSCNAVGCACRQRTEVWVNDARAQPWFFVTTEANDHLLAAIERDILAPLRKEVGAQRRVTLVFDREGWSPKAFARWAGGRLRRHDLPQGTL